MKVINMVAMLFSLLIVGNTPAEEAKAKTIDTVSGTAEDCIQISLIDSTSIIDHQSIVFHMKGGNLYLNRLPMPCEAMGKNDSLKYRTATSRLCNVDIITVLIRAGSEFLPGPSCMLGQFFRVTQDDVDMLTLQAQEKPKK